jgi:DNA polymerase elongation subunit (family B)
MVSFNGARFDNHLFMEYFRSEDIVCKRRGKMVKCKEWNYKSFIGDESTIKKFSIKCNSLPFENEVYFLDAALFITGISLKDACNTYGCKNLKDDDSGFDIKDYMEVSKIEENIDRIIEYGLQDVRALYELMELFAERMKESSKTDINVFDCVSIASYADRARDYYHDSKIEVYYNNRSEVSNFERACVYGGRVVVGCLKWDEGCIPADINSEYPASMYYYKYPCGKRTYYNRKLHPKKMIEYKDKLNNEEDMPLCNMKVKFRINEKCLIPMLPVKDCKDKQSLVQIGCYTVIELQEAVKHGKYEILEVLFAQVYESSEYMFKEFVQTFYDRRKEYKEEMKKADKDTKDYKKYNVLQDQCKLIMNSSFGILTLKAFDWEYSFVSEKTYERDKDETVSLVAISNGEYLVKYKNSCKHNNYKPIPLGAYILSYSKRILNEYIDIVGGFYEHVIIYCDTDSLYIPEGRYKLLAEKGKIGNELGQCKNDYEEGSKITDFWCIGKKCKICRIKQVDKYGKEKILIKTTIKGYKGLRKLERYANMDEEDLINKVVNEKDEKKRKKLEKDLDSMKNIVKQSKSEIYKINEWFNDVLSLGERGSTKEMNLNKEYESMKRFGLQINVVTANRSFVVTAYDQYKIDNNYKCYPLYYKFGDDHFKYML